MEYPYTLTQDLEKMAEQLPAFGAYETENSYTPFEDVPAVKFFTPDAGATWFVTEYEPQTRLFFGMCDMGMGFPELGYVSLDELLSVRGALGLPVEVDMHWRKSLRDGCNAVEYTLI